MSSQQPKVALVHDDFGQRGGAENLFSSIAQIYPDSPIFTSLINKERLPQGLSAKRIKTSWMQKIPFAPKFFKLLLLFYPLAFESFDFSNYDLVISSTTRFAKGIVTDPKTVHICYINSTPRFLWHKNAKSQYQKPFLESLTKPIFNWLKRYDLASSGRPDYFIANSRNVAKRVKQDYGREAEVVYPYADTDFFKPAKVHNWHLKSQNYFLVVSRLVKWKRIDLAIKACQALKVNLKIVGSGPDAKRLKKLANGEIEFLGHTSAEMLRELYQNAQGLIVTQEEDFGISIVEANACGIPVIAYGQGGQKEIILEGKTGLFFPSQSEKSLEDAISRASNVKWDISACQKNSLRFSQEVFVKDFKKAIASKINV